MRAPLVSALLLCAVALSAQAQSPAFTVRVPVATAQYTPGLQRFDFGRVSVGSTPSRAFTLTNRTVLVQPVGDPVLSGQARLVANGCPDRLAPGQSCQLTAGLLVAALGVGTGSVRVPMGAQGAEEALQLSAEGIAANAALEVSRTRVDFGAVAVRQAAPSVQLTLTNVSAADTTLSGLSLVDNPRGAFSLSSACPRTLAPGSRCTVGIGYTPVAPGFVQARLALADPVSRHIVALSGEGVAAEVQWSVPRVSFDGALPGVQSEPRTVTLLNSGRVAVPIAGLALRGDSAFSMPSHSCGAQLAAGASCQVQLSARVADSRPRQGALVLSSPVLAQGSTALALQARPQLPDAVLGVEPYELDFGDVPVGTRSASRTLTLTARGSTPVSVTRLALQGVSARQFELLDANRCLGLLAPGAQCTLSLVASPSAPQRASTALAVTTTASQPPLPVVLKARGTQGELLAAPSSLVFPEQLAGESSERAVTLVNAGTAAVRTTTPSVSGTNAAQFSVSGCAATLLEPGQSCQVLVRYRPALPGSHAASVSLAHGGVSGLLRVGLSGKARGPSVGALGAPTCGAPVVPNVPVRCSVTLLNTSAVALALPQAPKVGINIDPRGVAPGARPGVTALARCPTASTSLAPGASCTFGFDATFPRTGSNTVSFVLEGTSAGTLFTSASVQPQAGEARLVASEHPPTALAQASLSRHRLVNIGAAPLQLAASSGTALFRLKGASGLFADTSPTGSNCPLTLLPGESCLLQTRCQSNVAGTLTSSLEVSLATGDLLRAPVSCVVQGPDVRIEPAGPLTGQVGGWSNSGNFYRVTNTSAASLVFSSLTTEHAGWLALADSSDPTHCVKGRVLSPGGSCLFMTEFVAAVPGTTASAVQRVRLHAGTSVLERTLTDRQTVEGAHLALSTPFPEMSANVWREATYVLTNLAAHSLSGIGFELEATSVFVIDRHTCASGLAPAGQPGASCFVTLRARAPQAGRHDGVLHVNGGYPQVVNGQPRAVVRTGRQASLGVHVVAQPDRILAQEGLHATALPGSFSLATHTVTNVGVGPVTFGAVQLMAGPFRLEGGSCVPGLVLEPGASCTLQTRFSPSVTSPTLTQTGMTVNAGSASTMLVLRGQTTPSGDVSVALRASHDAVLFQGQVLFEAVVTNKGTEPAVVRIAMTSAASDPAVIQGLSVFHWRTDSGVSAVPGEAGTYTLPAGQRWMGYITVNTASVPGTVSVQARAELRDQVDRNPADNAATVTTSVIACCSAR